MLELLLARRFAPLFLTQFLGAFNDNVFKNALVIYIAFSLAATEPRHASMLVIAAGGVFILPFLLFSPVAGQLADKLEKALLIRRIKLAEIAIMTVGAAAFALESLWGLMAALFAMGLQSAAFGPLKYGILPQHLHRSELLGGNALVQAATYLAILCGTLAGGLVVAIRPAGPLLVGALTLALAMAGWLASRGIPRAAAGSPGLAVDWHLPRAIARLLREAAAAPGLLVTILGISWFWFVGAAALSLVPGYTRSALAGNEQVATLLLTAFSLGIGAGSLACGLLARRFGRLRLVPAGALGMALAAADLSLLGNPGAGIAALRGPLEVLAHGRSARAVLDLLLLAVAAGLYIVPLYTLLQRAAPAAARARLIAANNVLNALFMVSSAVLTMGVLAAGLDLPRIFGVIGAGCAASALLARPLRRGLGDSP